MTHVEVAKLMRGRKALDGQSSFRGDQDARLFGRHIGTEELVQGLKHKCRAELADRREDIDAATITALQELANAKIAVERMGGLHAFENGVSAVNHRPPPVFWLGTSESPRSGRVPVDPARI